MAVRDQVDRHSIDTINAPVFRSRASEGDLQRLTATRGIDFGLLVLSSEGQKRLVSV